MQINCWLILVGITCVACVPVAHEQHLVEPAGRLVTAPVGSPVATIQKQKDLPNIFGKADVWGRKVDVGTLKLIYKGPSKEGGVVIEQVDLDIHTNASVFTRMPGIYTADSHASVTGSVEARSGRATGTFSGAASGHATAFTPHVESNVVLPANSTTFVVPKGRR